MKISKDDLTLSSTDLNEATITSDAVQVEHVANLAVQIVTTGTHSGTLKLQASLDGSNWSDIPDASIAVSNAGAYFVNVSNIGFDYVRMVYTKSAFTSGVISSAKITTKGI